MTSALTGTHRPAAENAADPSEDGRTRCAWVRGHSAHYHFHDAEWGMFPDDEAFAQERLVLAAFQHGGMSLVDVLDSRAQIWEKLASCDLEKIGAMADGALDELAKEGGIFGDRARLQFVRDIAKAGVETGKVCKGLREYYLAVRFLAADEQIADMIERFPGFTREDAGNLSEMTGSVTGSAHERDCWRA